MRTRQGPVSGGPPRGGLRDPQSPSMIRAAALNSGRHGDVGQPERLLPNRFEAQALLVPRPRCTSVIIREPHGEMFRPSGVVADPPDRGPESILSIILSIISARQGLILANQPDARQNKTRSDGLRRSRRIRLLALEKPWPTRPVGSNPTPSAVRWGEQPLNSFPAQVEARLVGSSLCWMINSQVATASPSRLRARPRRRPSGDRSAHHRASPGGCRHVRHGVQSLR